MHVEWSQSDRQAVRHVWEFSKTHSRDDRQPDGSQDRKRETPPNRHHSGRWHAAAWPARARRQVDRADRSGSRGSKVADVVGQSRWYGPGAGSVEFLRDGQCRVPQRDRWRREAGQGLAGGVPEANQVMLSDELSASLSSLDGLRELVVATSERSMLAWQFNRIPYC